MAKTTTVEYEGEMVPAEELEFNADKEPWSFYTLEDGTVLRFKQVLGKVCRLTDKFKQDGEPIYVFNLGAVIMADVPRELKRKPDVE